MIPRQLEILRSMIPSRLLKGAGVLGRLWHAGTRCAAGWELGCCCGAPTQFCTAKVMWVNLAEELYGNLGKLTGNYIVLEAMTVQQFIATGLKVTVELLNTPGAPTITLGPDLAGFKESWQSMFEEGNDGLAIEKMPMKVLLERPWKNFRLDAWEAMAELQATARRTA